VEQEVYPKRPEVQEVCHQPPDLRTRMVGLCSEHCVMLDAGQCANGHA
jgi:hypothetical protein